MQLYKAERKFSLAREIKSWFWFILIFTILFSIQYYFSLISTKGIMIWSIIYMLYKIISPLFQYQISEIHIDNQSHEMDIISTNKMSGEKIKKYGLEGVSSEFLGKAASSSLLIYSKARRKIIVLLNPNHGFSNLQLNSVHNHLERKD